MKRTYIQPSAMIETAELNIMVVIDSDPEHGVDDGFSKEREINEALDAAKDENIWQDGLW